MIESRINEIVCFIGDILDIADALLILYGFHVVRFPSLPPPAPFLLLFPSLPILQVTSNINIFIGLLSIEIQKCLLITRYIKILLFHNGFL